MRAVRFHSYGDPSVLQIEELPVPEPGPDQVRIRVVSSSINPADAGGRSGIVRLVHARTLPHTPGYDVAGVVDACGPGVAAFLPGERVYAMVGLDAGGQAEYVCVQTDKLAPAPSRISLAEAGAVPLAGLTALQALRAKANLQRGQRLLVNGASGGVGSFAVQIGKAMGCHVTAVCRGNKAADMRELGADEVIDYKQEDFTQRAQTWDVVFDAAGNRDLRQVQAVLPPHGFMVATRPAPADLALNALHLAGHRPGYAFLITQARGQDLALLTRLIDQGAIRPLVDHIFSMDEIQEAHRYFEQGDLRGKIVVQIADEV
jgi:NADPH:quinone reductase-like Zn-dependent oxidoreductase